MTRAALTVLTSAAFASAIHLCQPVPAMAFQQTSTQPTQSITDRSVQWPSAEQWMRVLLLRDYNTRVVVISTSLLGCAAGMVGSFALLRRRALMGDALAHATLPGIGLAFMLATALGYNGKSLPVLLGGALVTGLIGVAAVLAIRQLSRLKDDAAMGIVLSVFFGAGVALLGIVQQMKQGHAAGLEAFILGKTASMVLNDAFLIAAAAAVSIGVSLLLFKEIQLLCFDDGFAGSQGMPIIGLDLVVMSLVVAVTIVGLQAVGLILMIALLVIPAAAARFWTNTTWKLFLISGVIGVVCGSLGAVASAVFYKLPSGAMIVLVCGACFVISLVFGRTRGVLVRTLTRWRLNRNVLRHHLLRALYELAESKLDPHSSPSRSESSSTRSVAQRLPIAQDDVISTGIAFELLLAKRSWSRRRLLRAIRSAERDGLVTFAINPPTVRLTRGGCLESLRLTRQHRLWELYLIKHADIAPSQVDRDADAIEHVLQPEIVAELESLLERAARPMPASPHTVQAISERDEPFSSVGG